MPRKYGKLDLDQADPPLGHQHALKGPFVIRNHEKQPPALKSSAPTPVRFLISDPIVLPATSMNFKSKRLCENIEEVINGIKLASGAAARIVVFRLFLYEARIEAIFDY